jgi:glycosyltransferase involved in cell wall biosynthesis
MMRTLIISGYPPSSPENSSHGIFKRLENFVEALRAEGDIDFLFFCGNECDVTPETRDRMERALRAKWGSRTCVFLGHKGRKQAAESFTTRYLKPILRVSAQSNFDDLTSPAQIADLETCLARRPDLVFAHRLEAMLLIMAARRPVPPVLYDIDDVEHVKFLRFMRQPPFWLGKALLYLQWPILYLTEGRAIRMAHTALVCSESDQAYLRVKCRLRNIQVIPNAVRIPEASAVPSAPVVLFLGNYGYGPNCGAAEFLATEIWPKVRISMPQARLVLAGRGADRLHLPQDRAGIEVRGFVADLDALYRDVRVVACPILAGGGTRFKIIEAAAYGRPIVSTALGAEGIPFVDRQEIRLADTSDQFASACVELLNDDATCADMAARSRAKAISLYDRDRIVERVRGIVRMAVVERGSS